MTYYRIQALSILLALRLKPRHGYELMQQISYDTDGHVRLGPGTLYGTIKHLHKDSLVEDIPFELGIRRRYYRLTKKGWDRLSSETRYYERTIQLARERPVLNGNGDASTQMI